MAEKTKPKDEEGAWKDYLSSIDTKPAASKKRFEGISESFKRILQKIGIRRKASEAKGIKKEIAISAKEGKRIAAREAAAPTPEKKPIEAVKPLPGAPPTRKPLGIDKYLARIEARKKAEARAKLLEKKPAAHVQMPKRPAKPTPAAPAPERPAAPKPERPLEKPIAGKPITPPPQKKPVEKQKSFARRLITPFLPRRPAEKKVQVSKKVEFLPKPKRPTKPAEKKEAKPKARKKARPKRKARAKRKAAAKRKARPKARKKAAKPRAGKLKPIRARMLAKFLKERPSLAQKPISEIKKLSPSQIKKEVKRERIENKARGWYGDVLRHQKAALTGWRIRKKVRLHQLRKKAKKKKLTGREQTQKKKLLADDRSIRSRMTELDSKIRTLKIITKKKKADTKLLEKKVRAAGVEIPKAEIGPVEKGRRKFKKKSEMLELVEAMRSVSDEMAATATKQRKAGFNWREALTVDDQLDTQKRLIKDLEIAFYKRKINFDQFREKMFEYQSKLSELRIRKKIVDEKKAKMSMKTRQELETKLKADKEAKAKEAKPAEIKVGMAPGTKKVLEKKPEAPKRVELEKETAEILKKLTRDEAKKAAEKAEDKRFAERTADALQKIAEKLSAKPEAKAEPPKPAPRPEAHKPEPHKREPHKGKGFERIRQVIEREEEKEKKEKEKPGKKIVERITERVIHKEEVTRKEEAGKPKGKPRISKVLDEAIRAKAKEAHLSKHDVDKIEEKLGGLLEKYHIPETTLTVHIKQLSSTSLVEDFQKLIHLIETKKGGAAAELIKPMPGFDITTGVTPRKRERLIGREREIRKAMIETSFDRVLTMVQMKGSVNLKEVAKQLDMKKKEVQECAEILERNNLIKLVYPPIGAVRLVYPEYLEWKRKQRKKKKKKK